MMQTGALLNGSIDTSGLAPGLFYVQLRDTDLKTVYVSRFVKQ